MAEGDFEGESNGAVLEEEEKDEYKPEKPRLVEIESMGANRREETLYTVLRRFLAAVLFSDPNASPTPPLLCRIKSSFQDNAPSLREASANSTRKLLTWTRQGSPFRALLIISVGAVTLLVLTGLLVFMLFFLAATTNAIIISFLMSLAAAGGFMALFLVCLATIYVAALSVALFVISTATISTIIAVLIATGWVGFLWIVWLATKKSMDLTKHSLSMTGSALSAYSLARHRHNKEQASG